MDLFLKVWGVESLLGPISITVEPLPGDTHTFDGKVYVLKGGRVPGAFGTPSRRVFEAEEITEPAGQA